MATSTARPDYVRHHAVEAAALLLAAFPNPVVVYGRRLRRSEVEALNAAIGQASAAFDYLRGEAAAGDEEG